MDSHDLGRDRGGIDRGGTTIISAETLLIGVRTDILFPPAHVLDLANAITAAGGRATYWELNSPHGHDAFLKEFDRLDTVLREGIGTDSLAHSSPPVDHRRRHHSRRGSGRLNEQDQVWRTDRRAR